MTKISIPKKSAFEVVHKPLYNKGDKSINNNQSNSSKINQSISTPNKSLTPPPPPPPSPSKPRPPKAKKQPRRPPPSTAKKQPPSKTQKQPSKRPPFIAKKQPRRPQHPSPKINKPRQGQRQTMGTRALHEIKKLQRSTDLLIKRRPFEKVVREIMYKYGNGLRIQRAAVDALQEAVEAMIIQLFEKSQLASIHAHRITLQPKDPKLVKRIVD